MNHIKQNNFDISTRVRNISKGFEVIIDLTSSNPENKISLSKKEIINDLDENLTALIEKAKSEFLSLMSEKHE